MRLIDADLLESTYMLNAHEVGRQLKRMIDHAPTVDAVPVRHGTWAREVLGSTSGYGTTVMYQCSECERMSISKHKYCPNCGAKMDGAERREE